MTSSIRALLTNSEIFASELFCFLPLDIAALQVGAGLYSRQAEDIRNVLQSAFPILLPRSDEKPPRFVDCDTPEFFPESFEGLRYYHLECEDMVSYKMPV